MQKTLLKTWLTVLGVAMVVLWIAGMSSGYASPALTWFDLAAGVLSFLGVAGTLPSTPRRTSALGTIALATGVFAIWLGGLVNGAPPWLTWWNFAFGCAYLFVGIAVAFGADRNLTAIETSEEFRRSA
jgi:hypothetical protein